MASAGRDGTLKRWIGAPEKISQLIVPPKKIEYSAIARLIHGRIAVADQLGNLEVWSGGKRIGESITTAQSAVSNILQLRNGDLMTAGSDGALKHWRDGQAMKDAKPTSVTQDVRFTMLETRSGELLIVGRRDGSVSRWKNGNHIGTFTITDPGMGVLAALELDNGDLLAGYEDGMVQRWRNGRRFGEPIRVVQGDLRRSLFRMFLLGLPNNGWISSTSGQGSTGNGKLRYWLNGMPAADGHSVDTGVMDTGRGELLGILLSDKGEIVIGTTTGVHRISLPHVASSLCSRVKLDSASANASLLLAVNAARDTCRSLGSKQS